MADEGGQRLRARLDGFTPRALLTLGSGLGGLADEVDAVDVIAFDDIGLPGPTVPGHAGRLIAGRLRGVPVLVQQGRVHLYENVGTQAVVAVVRAAASAGAEVFVATNAAGGLAQDMAPGDLMCIADHLNLTGANPLLGGPNFVDMKDAYDPGLRAVARKASEAAGHTLPEGVYAGLVGPSYETPAEVRMLQALGADAVGMSTVNEVIAARSCGLRAVGFSLITNVHRPGGTPTNHAEVLDVGRAAGLRLAPIIAELVAQL